MLDWT